MMMRFLLMDRSFFIISIVFIILFSISDARWFPELSSDRENSKSNPLTITDDDIHAQVAAPKEYQQADGNFVNFVCSLCIGMPSHSYNSHIFIPTFQLYRYIILCTDFLIPCFHVIITLLSLTLPSLYPLSLIISTPGLTVSKSSGSINLSFSIFDEDEEFYVRIQSEDGQKICDGIFSQHELENINCPYEK